MKRSSFLLRTCVFTTASLCFILPPAGAQTTLLDLKSQSRGFDFSKAASTKPFKTGTTLPATCTVGDTYFKSDATAGQNLYGCTALNTWMVESGGGFPSVSGNADHILGTDGTNVNWLALGGDISGPPQTVQVTGLRGNRVSSTVPSDGQVLRWNGSTLNWEPGTVAAGSAGTGSTNTGGDLYGPIGTATVTRIQNRPVSSATPVDGQVLTWNQSIGLWQPQASTSGGGSGGGSGSGGAVVNVLGVTYTSANTLTIGGGCSVTAPCNVRFGNNVIAITTASTITWQSGSGPAFIYVTSAGTVTVGSNLTLSCGTGCLTVNGISSFPSNTIPIYTWTALLTGWDPAGGHDTRAFLSSKTLSSGPGIFMVESGQQTTIGVDTTLVPTYTTGSASLTFGTLSGSSCSELTIPVPGANINDPLATGWPAALPASVLGTMRVTSANTVTVRLCNIGSSAAVVAASTYRATAFH